MNCENLAFHHTIMIRLLTLALSFSITVANDELPFITADCRGDITLPCTALQNCKSYTSVTWYKFYSNSSDKSTILKKTENVNNFVSVNKSTSLVLRKVAPSDSGIYKCLIRVKAGGMHCEIRFKLNISDCVSTPSPTTIDFTTTKLINESWTNISIPLTHVDNNSEIFVFWGFVGLAVSKLLLSAVCIWAFNELRELRRRRQT